MNLENSQLTEIHSTPDRPKVVIGRRPDHAKKAAQIHVTKKGETIETITIVCSCGEEITINCQYADVS